MSRETEHPAPDDELRQGDILRTPGSGDHPGLGVVINADCDLAQGKTDGVIAYLPIYSFRNYIKVFWAATFAKSQRREQLIKVLSLCKLEDSEGDGLLEWLAVEDSEAVAATLLDQLRLSPNQIGALRISLADLKHCFCSNVTAYEAFLYICRKRNDGDKFLRKQIGAAYKAIGEGHFFLNEIYGLDGIGFVVRMRRIYSIPEQYCFRSTAEHRKGGCDPQFAAIRIAKLTPLYRFKVTQLFAYQYSRVGLPDEITALKDLAIENMVEELTGGVG